MDCILPTTPAEAAALQGLFLMAISFGVMHHAASIKAKKQVRAGAAWRLIGAAAAASLLVLWQNHFNLGTVTAVAMLWIAIRILMEKLELVDMVEDPAVKSN